MRTPPLDVTDVEVVDAVAARWSISADTIEYAPVGFGSHHWVLTDRSGRRWFVTADAVADSSSRLAELNAALATAHALHHHGGLGFVVAPLAGSDDELLSITGRYAVSLYPHLEPATAAPADPQQILSMIIALHAATADLGHLATVNDLTIRDRSTLEAVLADPDSLPSTGPFTADFARLAYEYRQPIRAALDRHDAMAAIVGADHGAWVITHGEAKPNNTMITTTGPALVDWDTVQLAPPARDLWITGSTDTYASITGRHVPTDHLDFYRLRWDLKDLCGSAAWFTRTHQRTTDTELAWQGSISICRRLADSNERGTRGRSPGAD